MTKDGLLPNHRPERQVQARQHEYPGRRPADPDFGGGHLVEKPGDGVDSGPHGHREGDHGQAGAYPVKGRQQHPEKKQDSHS